jgi:hypothetical protein
MAILPATGSAITFGNVSRGYTNTTGSNLSLRDTLGGYLGIGGSVSLSSTFGGRTTPYAT